MTGNQDPRAGLREPLSAPERVSGSRDAGTALSGSGGRTGAHVADTGAILRVDEIGLVLHAPRETRTWWELYRKRHATRLTTVTVRMPGDLVDVACDDRAHAQWLHDQLRARGVPQRSLTVRTSPNREPSP